MKKVIFAGIATAMLLVSGCAHHGKKKIDRADYQEADKVVSPFRDVDSSIKTFLDKSVAYVVFPKVGKGAVGIGGAFGKGLVYEKGIRGYTLVGYSELTQITAGLQLGGQTYSEIIFFENEAAFNQLKKGSIELNTQASAVILKEGASAKAVYENGTAVFILKEKGLMGELSVGGQKISYQPAEKR